MTFSAFAFYLFALIISGVPGRPDGGAAAAPVGDADGSTTGRVAATGIQRCEPRQSAAPATGESIQPQDVVAVVAGFWTSVGVATRQAERDAPLIPEGIQWLVAELASSGHQLTIAPARGAVSIVDGRGELRRFAANGEAQRHHLAGHDVEVSTWWCAGTLRQRFQAGEPDPVAVELL